MLPGSIWLIELQCSGERHLKPGLQNTFAASGTELTQLHCSIRQNTMLPAAGKSGGGTCHLCLHAQRLLVCVK